MYTPPFTITAKIIDLISRISEKIGEYKKANNMTVLQQQRWDSLLEKYYKAADENNLDKKMIDMIFKAIHQASINIQTEILNQK